MRDSILKGFGFGITSGVITTLGLMIGLFASTNSKLVVIGGILSIAIADAFSDALGIHISEEASNNSSRKIWESTIATFLFKFLFASIFILPVWFLELKTAIVFSIFLGFFLIGFFSCFIAKRNKDKCFSVVLEHLLIASVVIILTYFIGKGINYIF